MRTEKQSILSESVHNFDSGNFKEFILKESAVNMALNPDDVYTIIQVYQNVFFSVFQEKEKEKEKEKDKDKDKEQEPSQDFLENPKFDRSNKNLI